PCPPDPARRDESTRLLLRAEQDGGPGGEARTAVLEHQNAQRARTSRGALAGRAARHRELLSGCYDAFPMDIVIGLQARDGGIRAVVADDKVDEFKKELEAALTSGEPKVIWVKDKDDHDIAITVEKIAFVEFGAEKHARQVGFSAAS